LVETNCAPWRARRQQTCQEQVNPTGIRALRPDAKSPDQAPVKGERGGWLLLPAQ
ncbi:hypothetical protein PspLS_07428, partial [Pyricularia sp. CBS 133598]